MKQIAYILILITSIKSFSQENDTDFMVQRNNLSQVDLRDKSITGTRFITNNFISGKIEKSKKDISFKYDAYQDEIEVKIDNKANIFLRKKLGFKISFQNKAYQVFKDENHKLAFFLVSNTCSKNCLLVNEKIELTEAVEPKNGYQTYQPAKFSNVKEIYYLTYDGVNAKKIPTKKKEFFSFFGDKEKDIKTYMKDNKLNRKTKEDLIKIIDFFKTI